MIALDQKLAFRTTSRKITSVFDAALIRFPQIQDARGNLTFIEGLNHIPFNIKRAYWIYDVPGGESRGSHAFRKNEECIVSLSGSFEVLLDDGYAQKIITLNRAYFGLYIPKMIWRSMQNFSTNSVALVLASQNYSSLDYIRNYSEYIKLNYEDNC